MNLNIDFYFDAASTLLTLIAWGLTGAVVLYIRKNRGDSLKLWKVALVVFLGSLTFDIYLYERVNLPVLPLGFLVLLLATRKKPLLWLKLKPYAWSGVAASFLLAGVQMVAPVVHDAFYNKDDLHTYITNPEETELLSIHPKSLKRSLITSELERVNMKRISMNVMEWHSNDKQVINTPHSKRMTLFPYIILGAEPLWGSGLDPVIHIRKDGKALLIETNRGQAFYELSTSILEGE
ncbi:hypothetical protein LCL89_09080 [Halobacillus yeomjeoni]|uniref:hypothetical protein n=1 Tax=Halobacillus yeomjeoni TaxID=311194 RepID=UPI001CD61BF8|nr:hypothetical protein [Halobacillus yeomjeoni]MCA0984195.1 hypothetical protein [Halobacillus yeomjeoni]